LKIINQIMHNTSTMLQISPTSIDSMHTNLEPALQPIGRDDNAYDNAEGED